MGDDDPLCVTTAEHVSAHIERPLHSITRADFNRQWIYETLRPVSVGGPYPAVSPDFSYWLLVL